MRTAAETQDGGADLHRSAGSSLLHTPTAVAVTSRTNTYCDNHGRRNNRHLDELRDNAGFKAGLSRMDKANIVNITDANLELSMSDLNSRQQRHSNVLKCEQKQSSATHLQIPTKVDGERHLRLKQSVDCFLFALSQCRRPSLFLDRWARYCPHNPKPNM